MKHHMKNKLGKFYARFKKKKIKNRKTPKIIILCMDDNMMHTD